MRKLLLYVSTQNSYRCTDSDSPPEVYSNRPNDNSVEKNISRIESNVDGGREKKKWQPTFTFTPKGKRCIIIVVFFFSLRSRSERESASQ